METKVRDATEKELLDLTIYIEDHFVGDDTEAARDLIKDAYITVIEGYIPDSPGKFGNIMVVIWGGGMEYYEHYTWDKNDELYRIISHCEEEAAKQGEAKEVYP